MSGTSWAALLGMVHVPMFGARKAPKAVDESAILLDGPRASFAFLRTDDAEFTESTEPLSWSWSSCVTHNICVLPGKDWLYLRRWDEPLTTRKFEIPRQGVGAESLLATLERSLEPRRPGVVRHVLKTFRQIRTRIHEKDPLWAMRFLNGLLLVAEAIRKNKRRRKDAEGIRTFGEAFQLLREKDRTLCGVDSPPRKDACIEARDLIQWLVDPDRYTGCQLHPALLFRHAASKLYQEAHLEIEKNPQGYFLGMEPTGEPVGISSPRDVRFTPPNLARALVQKALEALLNRKGPLTILDPACGSGVFLVEAIRELIAAPSGRKRTIRAVGYDISSISEYTTRFCLEHAMQDKGATPTVQTEVVKCDSLDRAWESSDIILMNPPFIPWDRLTDKQRQQVGDELGDAARQRPDIAMAFVSKAVGSLKPGGVLGCVLPASLLTSQTGIAWREYLGQEGSLQLLGRFEGYKYFPTSVVETAFLIYRKRLDRKRSPEPVEVLIATEGSENAALRALRLKPESALSIKGVERFTRPSRAFAPENWRPLRQEAYEKKDRIASLSLPRAGELFEIRQGARLGHKAFLLTASQYSELNRKERKFFHPAAGGGSIKDGRLRRTETEYVFYPYATDGGSLFGSEEELKQKLPKYYDKYLEPVKQKLAGRPRFSNRKWWELSEKRAWQTTLAPRLLSAYFGESGSFAFDEDGEYVTVNGHAWFWKRDAVPLADDSCMPFEQTPAVWAYLALLNSRAFESIMSLFSVRLQGGQMRLERRFLSQVPLPDFTNDMQTPAGIVEQLIKFGKAVHAGKLREVADAMDSSVSMLYGLK